MSQTRSRSNRAGSVRAPGWAGLCRTVDVVSVINPADVDNPYVLVDPVDDPILPDPGAASAGGLAPKEVDPAVVEV